MNSSKINQSNIYCGQLQIILYFLDVSDVTDRVRKHRQLVVEIKKPNSSYTYIDLPTGSLMLISKQ